MRNFLAACLLSALLAGCDWGGPSAADIERSYNIASGRITDLKCQSASDKPEYVCSFALGNPYNVMTRRFVKNGGEWVIAP